MVPLLLGLVALLAVTVTLQMIAADPESIAQTESNVSALASADGAKGARTPDAPAGPPLAREAGMSKPISGTLRPDQAVVVTTFLDAVPLPTVLLRVDSPPEFGLRVDWTTQDSEHRVARAERPVMYALLGKGALIEILDPTLLPEGAEHRVDLQRGKTLQVHLTNVPSGIRENLTLFAQVRSDQHESDYEKHLKTAAYALRAEFPVEMPTDFAEIPLVMNRDGTLVVWAQGNSSPKMFIGNEVRFDFANPRVEVDVSPLATVATLATVHVTLEFPYAYPSGKMFLSLDGLDGKRIWQQKFDRETEREVVVTLRDIPLTSMVATVETLRVDPTKRFWLPTGDAKIKLPPWDVTSVDYQVRRVVDAESSLTVTLVGVPPGTQSELRILMRDQEGGSLAGQRVDKGSQVRAIKHLCADSYYVQALSYDDAFASPVYKVDIGTAQSLTLAMAVLPAGKVDVGPVEGDSAPTVLDVASKADGCSSRFFLNAEGLRRFVCPAGEYDVQWNGRTKTIRVDAGGLHSLNLR